METSIRRGLPRAVVDDVFLAPVHINAGGTHYTTTLDTLTRYPESKLAKLFDGTLPIPIDPISRQYFLDINGSVFVHVLDFLRYGELLLPEGFTQLPLLTKLADYFEIQDMLQLLTHLQDRWNNSCQSESEEDNEVQLKRHRICKKTNASGKSCKRNIKIKDDSESGDTSGDKDVGSKNVDKGNISIKAQEKTFEEGSLKAKSLDVGTVKSDISKIEKLEAKRLETDSVKTDTIEVGTLKSEVTEMISIGAVNVEMTSVDAHAVRTKSLEVGTLMAMTLEVGTLVAGRLETETHPGPVKVALVRYDEYYKIIDIYSPDELTLVNPMFPHQLVRSEYIGNCNRLFYNFAELPCENPQTKYKFGVPYLLHFFKQLLNKGYQFSSVIAAGELNYTRDYMLIRLPSSNSRP